MDLELGTELQAEVALTEDLQRNTNSFKFNYSLYDDLDLPRWDSAMLCAAISRMKNTVIGVGSTSPPTTSTGSVLRVNKPQTETQKFSRETSLGNSTQTGDSEQSPPFKSLGMQSDALTKHFDLPYPAYGHGSGPIRLGGSRSVQVRVTTTPVATHPTLVIGTG